jgi:hypothetical protein
MKLNLQDRINLLVQLGVDLSRPNEKREAWKNRISIENPWFTETFSQNALNGIIQFLDKDVLENFVGKYPDLIQNSRGLSTRKIGLILSGNLPAVGWHDVMCTFLAGYHSKIKLSENDNHWIPYFIDVLESYDSSVSEYFSFERILKDFDAVIATGSNNSSLYFESYFGKFPNIIRKNRNSVAILDGSETDLDLQNIATDIMLYFGLGCRSVSKVYIPKEYDLEKFVLSFEDWVSLANHSKYRNNYDYNYAMFVINRLEHFSNRVLLFIENESLQSRIASLHYERYEDLDSLKEKILSKKDELQCVVANESIQKVFGSEVESMVLPGQSQYPKIDDFADRVDTMKFLLELP